MLNIKKGLKCILLSALLFGGSKMVFSQSNNHLFKGSETISKNLLLKRSDTVLLLIDHQVGLLSGVRDIGTADLSNNVAALAKAAKILGIPIIITNVTSPGDLWGPLIPELAKEVSGIKIIRRTAINAWDDPKVVEAVRATGRKQILIAGISLEVCAAFPALSAHEQGYDARIVLDASGTFNEAKRQSGIQRLTVAGVPLTDYATASVELLGDNADPKANDVYAAMNMPFVNIVWQLNEAAKKGAK